jgi:hypothetical protein
MMSNSRNILKWIFVLIVSVFIQSCTDDTGDTGFSDARDKFEGTWSCRETISGSSITFPVVITKYGGEDSVTLNNFSSFGDPTYAFGIVSGSSIVIPNQDISNSPVSFIVSGSGIYSSTGSTEKITFNYQTDGDAATAIYTK